ncbi:MAG: hypothetical protein OXU23_15005 [Candidatus Poribacteria bacterium]|nr:hypothetical protein [Candidatus Poribacteria bacterium]MDE0467099.1 hypothetical protein [Candidatus Poribacteria bacterium]
MSELLVNIPKDSWEYIFRRGIGDGGASLRSVDASLPLDRFPVKKSLDIPKASGKDNIAYIGLYFNGDIAQAERYFRSAPWTMQSFLRNSDAQDFTDAVDFMFLVQDIAYEKFGAYLKTARVPQENIKIISLPSDIDTALGENDPETAIVKDRKYPGTNALKILMNVSPYVLEHERVMSIDADFLLCRPTGCLKSKLFEKLLDPALENPLMRGGWGEGLPDRYRAGKIRGVSMSRSEIGKEISRLANMPQSHIEKIFYEENRSWRASSSISLLPVKKYTETYPEYVEFFENAARSTLGRSDEMAWSVWAYYLDYHYGYPKKWGPGVGFEKWERDKMPDVYYGGDAFEVDMLSLSQTTLVHVN